MNELTQMPREPEAFGEMIMRLIRRKWPGQVAELTGPLDLILNRRHLGLENLYRMVRHEPERGAAIVEGYVSRLFEAEAIATTPVPLSTAKARIMPRIQPVTIFEHLNKDHVAHIPFVNETVVVFVQDMPQMMLSITIEQMRGWGLDLDELDDLARKNLKAYTLGLEIQYVDSCEDGRAAIIARQDGYDAARLLHPALYEYLSGKLRGDFYVAVPARDMFLAMTFGPEEFVDRIRGRVRQEFKRMPYPITDRLFVVTRDGIAGTYA